MITFIKDFWPLFAAALFTSVLGGVIFSLIGLAVRCG